jgi:regulator of protease activity HflC (stomatin/prohibitin superfamily)
MALLESGMLLFWPLIVVILIVGLLSFFTVQTAQVAVITRFGKFRRVAEPGLNWKWPFIDRVAGRVSLRVNQITLTMETKTKDNVFVTIPISVQNASVLIRCLLQAVRPDAADPGLCRAGHSRPCARHDAG